MLRFSILRMIRRAKPRATGRTVLRAIVPAAVQRHALERIYMRVVRQWGAEIAKIIPAYSAALANSGDPGVMVDEDSGQVVRLSTVMTEIADEVERLVLSLDVDVITWAKYLEHWHRTRWIAHLQPHNVTASTLVGPEDVRDTLDVVVRQNVSLVRNVSATQRRAVEQIVFDGFQKRLTAREIARQLAEATGIARDRALRIASHQTTQLSALLDEERMRQAGLDEYQWQHSGKVHFRPHHKARDGKVFKWGDIAADDMPGIPPWCGCKKRVVISYD